MHKILQRWLGSQVILGMMNVAIGKLVLLLVTLLYYGACQAHLSWRKIGGQHELDGLATDIWTGKLNVPCYYGQGDGAQRLQQGAQERACRMEIFVRRFQRGRPLFKLILLAGGPGQSSKVWLSDLNLLVRLLQNDFLILAPDHRGVGHSSKLISAEDDSWREDLATIFQHHQYRPNMFTISNAARDIKLLADSIDQDEGILSLLGVSYGGLWAARAVALFPDRFDVLLLDSPSMIGGRFDHTNDYHFWLNCLDHHICRNHVRSYDRARRIYHQVMESDRQGTRRRNGCQRDWQRILGRNRQNRADFVRPFLRDSIVSLEEASDFHSAMLVVPFILHTYQCRDRSLYRKILKKMENLTRPRTPFKESVLSFSSSTSTVLESPSTLASFKLNNFINSYICCAEIFAYDAISSPKACAPSRRINTAAEQCTNYEYYLTTAYPLLSSHLYTPDKHRKNLLSSHHTHVYLLQGQLDLITPARPAEKWLLRINAPHKMLLPFRNLGHGLVPRAPCLKYLFAMLRGRKKRSRSLERCMSRINSNPLDWSFAPSSNVAFAGEWWQKLDVKGEKTNKGSSEDDS